MPQPIDEDPGKSVHIWARTGPKPLLAGREREPVWRRGGWHDWRPQGQEYPLVDHWGEGFRRLPARGGGGP